MKYVLYLLLALLGSSNSFAALNLELTQGLSQAIPIAVVSFRGENTLPQEQRISEIITNDLRDSGRFELLSREKMPEAPAVLKEVNVNAWLPTQVNNLVIGEVHPLGEKQYQVRFWLMNLYPLSAKQDRSQLLIKEEKFSVSQSQLRLLAHQISDEIYKQLTGKRGIFTTQLTYVLVEKNTEGNEHYSLKVADYDGHNPQTLVSSTGPIMSPSWSPDGRQIAFVSLANHKAAIYTVRLSDGKIRQISSFPGINGAPAWSPKANKLAIVLSKTGYAKIYLDDLQTNALTQLTNGWSIDTEPGFATDGKSVIFTSNRSGGPQIYKFNLASRKITRMTFDGNYNTTASFFDRDQKLALLHGDSGGFNVAVQDLRSSAMTILTDDGYASSPSVSPNGQMIVFSSNKDGHSELGMVSIDGKIKLRIPAPEGSVQEPEWSPYLS